MGFSMFVAINIFAFALSTIGNIYTYVTEKNRGALGGFTLLAVCIAASLAVTFLDPMFYAKYGVAIWYAVPLIVYVGTLVIEVIGLMIYAEIHNARVMREEARQ